MYKNNYGIVYIMARRDICNLAATRTDTGRCGFGLADGGDVLHKVLTIICIGHFAFQCVKLWIECRGWLMAAVFVRLSWNPLPWKMRSRETALTSISHEQENIATHENTSQLLRGL